MNMKGFVAACLATCGDNEAAKAEMRRAVEAVTTRVGSNGSNPLALLTYDWSNEPIPAIVVPVVPMQQHGHSSDPYGGGDRYGGGGGGYGDRGPPSGGRVEPPPLTPPWREAYVPSAAVPSPPTSSPPNPTT